MKRPFRGMPWPVLCLAAALQVFATPPLWFPGAPLLVVPGLAAQYLLATGAHRPLLASYCLGALHIGAFSWSLRHVAVVGWLLIAAIGGLYFVAAAVATRRVRRGGALPFAIAVAGAAWLRAELPGIAYPHGQPCHGFAAWPHLLGAVLVGGEPLANGLLAGLGAAAARVALAWRLAVPPLAGARRELLCWLAAVAAVTASVLLPLCGVPLRGVPQRDGQRAADSVRVAALETGVHPMDSWAGIDPMDRAAYQQRFHQLLRERLLSPTDRVAGIGAAAPPDLVLWPESSIPYSIEIGADGSARFDALRGAFSLAERTHVCLGLDVELPGRRLTPAAALVDSRGQFVAHHEKQRLVPAGEALPFIELLPAATADTVRQWLQTRVGIPAAVPGRALPPLVLPAVPGRAAVPFAALLCYDNAFPDTVASAVAAGARFIAVLSNEAWYRGGGELDQLAAITVLRAVAADTPIVRCTTDGRSLAVDRHGVILASLPPAPAPTPGPAVLEVDLPLGDGRLPPMAWLHPWFGRAFASVLLALCLHAFVAWAKLLRLGHATAGGKRQSAESLSSGS